MSAARDRIEVDGLRAELRAEHRRAGSLREAFVAAATARTVRTRRFAALDDVSFSVGRGELVGVIGPNGAGKTTLLRVLAGIVPPAAGSVYVSGRVAPLIDLGAGFDPDLTGEENVLLYGSLLGLGVSRLRAGRDAILEFAGVTSARDVPVGQYSAGMTARLGFAIATAAEPDVLLVDEVLAVGDEAFRGRCVERIEKLRSGGTAVVLVSHDLAMVEGLAARTLRLEVGRQVAFGASAEICDGYRREAAA